MRATIISPIHTTATKSTPATPMGISETAQTALTHFGAHNTNYADATRREQGFEAVVQDTYRGMPLSTQYATQIAEAKLAVEAAHKSSEVRGIAEVSLLGACSLGSITLLIGYAANLPENTDQTLPYISFAAAVATACVCYFAITKFQSAKKYGEEASDSAQTHHQKIQTGFEENTSPANVLNKLSDHNLKIEFIQHVLLPRVREKIEMLDMPNDDHRREQDKDNLEFKTRNAIIDSLCEYKVVLLNASEGRESLDNNFILYGLRLLF